LPRELGSGLWVVHVSMLFLGIWIFRMSSTCLTQIALLRLVEDVLVCLVVEKMWERNRKCREDGWNFFILDDGELRILSWFSWFVG
jgi:hypothetical protein